MFEIHRPLAVLFGELLDDGGFVQQDGDWQSGKLVKTFFTRIQKKGSPVLRKEAGRKAGALFLEEMKRCYEWGGVREALAFLPKVYNRFVRGDGAGVWISDELSDGFCNIRENTPFDCFFTEGLLSGLLAGMGARGAMVRHPECRKDTEGGRFCRYELVWMKNVVR